MRQATAFSRAALARVISGLALGVLAIATTALAQDGSPKSGESPNGRDSIKYAVKTAFLVSVCENTNTKIGCGQGSSADWDGRGTATFIYANETHAYFLTAAHVVAGYATPTAPKRHLEDLCEDDKPGKAARSDGADGVAGPNLRLSISINNSGSRTTHNLYGVEIARVYDKPDDGSPVVSADVSLIEAKLPTNQQGRPTAFSEALQNQSKKIELRFSDLPTGARKSAYHFGYPYTSSSSVSDPEPQTYSDDFDKADALELLTPPKFGAPQFAALIFKQGEARAEVTNGNSGAGLLIDMSNGNPQKPGAQPALDDALFWLAGVLKEAPNSGEFCRKAGITGVAKHACNMLLFSSLANWKEVWPLLFSIRPAKKICEFRDTLLDSNGEIDTERVSNMTALERMLFFWTMVKKDEDAIAKFLGLKAGAEANNLAATDENALDFTEYIVDEKNRSFNQALECHGSRIANHFGNLHPKIAKFIENMQLKKKQYSEKCHRSVLDAFSVAGDGAIREALREKSRGGLSDDAGAYLSGAATRSFEEALAAYDEEAIDQPTRKARLLAGLAMADRLDPGWDKSAPLQDSALRYAEAALQLDPRNPLALVVISDVSAAGGDMAGAIQARAVAVLEARDRASRAAPDGGAPSRDDAIAAEAALLASEAGDILAQFPDEARLREVATSPANPFN